MTQHLGDGPSPAKLYQSLSDLASPTSVQPEGRTQWEPGRSAEQQVPEIAEERVMMRSGIHRGYCPGAAQSSLRGKPGTHTATRDPTCASCFLLATLYLPTRGWGGSSTVPSPPSQVADKNVRGCHSGGCHCFFRCQPLLLPGLWPACSSPLLPQELNLWWEARSHILLKRGLMLPSASEAQPTGIHNSPFAMK